MSKLFSFLRILVFYYLAMYSTALMSQELNLAPDVIFYNGVVLTMEPDQPQTEAIAVIGNLILALGSNQEIQELQSDETILVNLEGKTLMPGIVDAHTHLFFGSETALGYTLEESQQWALENGITTIGLTGITPKRLERIQIFNQEGKLIIRANLYLAYTTNCGELQDNWWINHPRTDMWGEKLRIAGVKIITDGGTCGESAVSFEYTTGGYGDLWFTQEELNTHLTEINDAGYQACLHAQGDRAVEQCMNAIEYALNEQPNTLRHRIDHNSYIRPDMVTRYSEIGIVPVIFGQFFTCTEQGIIDYIGTDPLPWFENWHDLLAANPGLPIAWHSDTPWLEIDPFYNMYNYVTRKDFDEEGNICEPSPWNEAATITVQQTLPLLTTGPAYALFREDELGSLKPGKLADIIIISANPSTVEPDSIVSIKVLMTMVNGVVEFCRPGNESLCPGSLGISTHDHSLVIPRSYPNPFSTSTTIEYELSHPETVTIMFYNQFGKQVDVIEQKQSAGLQKILWTPESLADGVYYFKIQYGEQVATGKLVLMRYLF